MAEITRNVVPEECKMDTSPAAGAMSGVVVVEADSFVHARDDEAIKLAREWAQSEWKFRQAAISSRPFNAKQVGLDGNPLTEEQAKDPGVARMFRSSIRVSGT